MSKKVVIKARALLGLMLLCGAAIFSARAAADAAFCEWEKPCGDELRKCAIVARGSVETLAFSRERVQFSPPSEEYTERLFDFNYLTQNIFLTDSATRLFPSDIDVRAALEKDFSVDTSQNGPQVLIFHTHSREMFADSDPDNPWTGVMGVGRHLAEILKTHGLEVLHHTERFDIVDGRPLRDGSYERVEPSIRQILADNPSIQVVIDLHRDGIPEHRPPMVTYINGQRTAQIMFVNGLSRRVRGGEASAVEWLPNPYQRDNLAFTLNLQLAANQMYPDFARRAYLLPFRYSLHMAPRSMLLEVGAQNNTFQEALNAMPPMADIIAAVVLGEQ